MTHGKDTPEGKKISITEEQAKELNKYYQSDEVQDWLNAPMGTPKAGEVDREAVRKVLQEGHRDYIRSGMHGEMHLITSMLSAIEAKYQLIPRGDA